MKNIENKVLLKVYGGNNSLIKPLQSIIEKKYSELFIAVIVHGSIATNEEIYYSDFDGLLIVKDQYRNSDILNSFIKESQRYIYRFDPLQHHGWFQIYEKDLLDYPQSYLPVEVLGLSKLIYPKNEINLSISIQDKTNYVEPFLALCNGIQSKIERGFYPRNAFQLKSFLSEIMLLPTLFYQAKHQCGIDKKNSFLKVRNELDTSHWSVIEKASYIRMNWAYDNNILTKNFSTFQRIPFFKKIARKYLAPKSKKNLILMLDSGYFNTLNKLCNFMKSKIYEI